MQSRVRLVRLVNRDTLLEVEVDLLVIVGLARAGVSWHFSWLILDFLLVLEWFVLGLDHLLRAELLGRSLALLATRARGKRSADGAWVLEYILLGIATLVVSLHSLLGICRGLQNLPIDKLLLVDMGLKLEGLRAGLGLGRACTFVLGLVIISEADNGGARHERHLIRCTLGSLRKEGSIIEQRVRSWVSQGKRLVELFPKVIELAHVKLDLVFPELSIGLRECFYISISL